MTGILERPYFIESLNLLKAADKGAKTISVISDDSPTSSAIYDYIKGLESKSPVKIASFDSPPRLISGRH